MNNIGGGFCRFTERNHLTHNCCTCFITDMLIAVSVDEVVFVVDIPCIVINVRASWSLMEIVDVFMCCSSFSIKYIPIKSPQELLDVYLSGTTFYAESSSSWQCTISLKYGNNTLIIVIRLLSRQHLSLNLFYSWVCIYLCRH